MKHTIKARTEEELGQIYERFGGALLKLGLRITRIKVDVDTLKCAKMTIWDDAPVLCFRFWVVKGGEPK